MTRRCRRMLARPTWSSRGQAAVSESRPTGARGPPRTLPWLNAAVGRPKVSWFAMLLADWGLFGVLCSRCAHRLAHWNGVHGRTPARASGRWLLTGRRWWLRKETSGQPGAAQIARRSKGRQASCHQNSAPIVHPSKTAKSRRMPETVQDTTVEWSMSALLQSCCPGRYGAPSRAGMKVSGRTAW